MSYSAAFHFLFFIIVSTFSFLFTIFFSIPFPNDQHYFNLISLKISAFCFFISARATNYDFYFLYFASFRSKNKKSQFDFVFFFCFLFLVFSCFSVYLFSLNLEHSRAHSFRNKHIQILLARHIKIRRAMNWGVDSVNSVCV